MHTRTTNITFEFFGILYSVAQLRVRRVLSFLKHRNLCYCVGKIHLWHLAIHFVKAIRDGFTQSIRLRQREFFHAGHILNGVLGGHGAIGDDVGAVFLPVFVFHPFEHTRSTVVVEVGIDIGQRNTVGIEETLKQQVVLHWVDFGNTKAISHNRTGSRATSRTHHNAKFRLGGIDKVLHNQEVTREPHGFHDVKFKSYAVVHFLVERRWVKSIGAFVSEFCQIVGFKFYSEQLVVATEFGYFFFAFFLRQLIFTVFVAGKLLKQIFGGEFFSPLFLGAEILGYGEERHNRVVLDVVEFHLIEYLQCVAERFGYIGKDGVHFSRSLKPLLLGIKHTLWVVEFPTSRKAYQVVVCFGVVFVDEVNIVGAYQFHIEFFREFYEHLIHFLLKRIYFEIGALSRVCLVALEFEVIIFAKHTLEPFYNIPRIVDATCSDEFRHLTTQASRAHYQIFMKFGKMLFIDARVVV